MEDAPDCRRKKEQQAEARDGLDAKSFQAEDAGHERESGAYPESATGKIADDEAAGPGPSCKEKSIAE